MRRLAGALVLTLLLAAPAATGAQSITAADGLGAPVDAMGARHRALGGTGIGLFASGLVPTDPAAMADLIIPSLEFSLQTSWVDVNENDVPGSFTATRFPVIGVTYPVGGVGVFSLSFGSLFDQEWELTRTHTITLEGSGSEARVTDRFSSLGGISTFRVGFARRLAPTVSVGATLGSYTGDVSRVFTRSFDSLLVETSVPDFAVGGQWRYSGLTGSVGVSADLLEVVRVAGSVQFGGTLKANATDETDGGDAEFPMPNEIRLGASALLAPNISMNLGVVRGDWSDVGALYDGVTGNAVTTFGGGFELTGASMLGKDAAFRVGYRRGGMPFAPTGAEDPTESRFSAGFGLDLLTAGPIVVAGTDFTLERGTRTFGSSSEEFWRFSVSLRTSGF